jgi:predicted peptidase
MVRMNALLLVLFFSCCAAAQDRSLYEKHWLIKGQDTLPYRLLLPKNYDPKKEYPLILFLHGAGERGNDNEAQLTHGWKLFLTDSIRDKYPAIVVFPQCPANSFPQCPANSYWSNVETTFDSISKSRMFLFGENGDPTIAMKMVLKLLNELDDNYALDKDRLYVGGLSMGGMGTFELVRRKPKIFAAAFPICGGANAATAGKLTKPAWWIFHGLKDNVVSPTFSQTMAGALKAEGATVRLTLYPDATHNSWDSAFAEKDLLPWLFSNHK